jgi:hypothetical protein
VAEAVQRDLNATDLMGLLCPGVKCPGRDVDHPPPSSAEVKERVELYLYSPSGT